MAELSVIKATITVCVSGHTAVCVCLRKREKEREEERHT